MPADRREEDSEGLLRIFGLSESVERVWRALLSSPAEDVGGLAASLALSEISVRRALETLASASLARPDQAPSGFAAYEPTLAVETLIARAEREVAAQRAQLQALRASVPHLADTYARARATSGAAADLDVVHSLDDIRERIFLAGERTKNDHRHLIRNLSAATIRNTAPVDAESLARGVNQRSLIGADELADPDVYAALGVLHEMGEQIRSVSSVPTQMMIMDRHLVVLPRAPVDSSRGALFIREQTIVDLMICMFDQLWMTAQSVFGDAQANGAPTGRVARVLEFMASGVIDERIGRTLDIGVRTVRRDIAELKELLGVSSRTEIVAAAVRKGWL
jgi:DNA-binding CsgD family transcriptional regulator